MICVSREQLPSQPVDHASPAFDEKLCWDNSGRDTSPSLCKSKTKSLKEKLTFELNIVEQHILSKQEFARACLVNHSIK